MILLPPPSTIGAAFWQMLPDLLLDVQQTVLFAAIPGFMIGTGLGFLAGAAADRSPFLQQGLMPLSNFASVIPIVGVAPIMIMWFGFGGESKAAVVILVTFFPAFVNMIAGLQQASRIERDLMTSYAASDWQTMWKLRLPAALPFLFAALKINASLSLIGAIVAEFFGTPVHGIGFRISAEIGHLALDHVWAAIVIAALVGSLSYALLAMAERSATFWHPSQLSAVRGPNPEGGISVQREEAVPVGGRGDARRRPGVVFEPRLRAGLGIGSIEMGVPGAVRRLYRCARQRLLQGPRPGRHHQAGRPGSGAAAGDRQRWRRLRRGLAAQRPVGTGKGGADGQHRAVLRTRRRHD
jgi:NitT/TauT family transport system permease protein